MDGLEGCDVVQRCGSALAAPAELCDDYVATLSSNVSAMSTDIFDNGTEGDFEAGTSWMGGTAPGPADSAVIDSAGDIAASLAGNGNVFADYNGDSIGDLTGDVMVVPDPIFVFNNTSNPPVSYEYFPDTSAAAQTTPGETISDEAIDLIGSGSVASLYLQNSTLAADTVVAVNRLPCARGRCAPRHQAVQRALVALSKSSSTTPTSPHSGFAGAVI